MTLGLPEIHAIRDGETAWTESHQHTGLTDIPLTERSERPFGEDIPGGTFAHVFASTEDVVLGGGSAKDLSKPPKGCRMGDNAHAFLGGMLLWENAESN